MGVSNGIAWTDKDLAALERLYPSGGPEACMAEMPHRSRQSIMQRASLRGLRLRRHRGGNPSGKRKPEGPYIPSGSEAAKYEEQRILHLTLQSFAAITRTGQLRPIVTVELEAA